jgi:hypothetical protein
MMTCLQLPVFQDGLKSLILQRYFQDHQLFRYQFVKLLGSVGFYFVPLDPFRFWQPVEYFDSYLHIGNPKGLGLTG